MSPSDAKEMISGAERYTRAGSDGSLADALRRSYLGEGPGIGTMPPPASLKGILKTAATTIQGEKPTVFLDKLGERLAFERTGTRLYEGLLLKYDACGGFPGGPAREDLAMHLREEQAHLAVLKQTIEELGADPTVRSPCADLAAVESMGILQVVRDARTNLAQSLHAMLAAGLVDNCAWEKLGELAKQLGYAQLVERFTAAQQAESRHLATRHWVAAHAAKEATLGAAST